MHFKHSSFLAFCFGRLLATALAAVAGTHALHLHHGAEKVIEESNDYLAKRAPGNPEGPTYRCHDPDRKLFGPAPSVEDCTDVINQYKALTTEINVQLVAGCYQIVSGNCTGLVCPQRDGSSTMSGPQAAGFMQTPILDECISQGSRGWWIDGRDSGIGVYLV